MAERRAPFAVPRGEVPTLPRLWDLLTKLTEYVLRSHNGLPAPHVHVDPSTGEVADPATGGGGAERMFTYFSSGA